MLKEMTIGQYFPGDSLLHRMDPRMKLTLTVGFIVLIFLPQNWIGLGAAMLYLAAAVALSRLPVGLIFRSIRPVLLLVAFTAVLNMFYVTEGEPLLDVWIIRITWWCRSAENCP